MRVAYIAGPYRAKTIHGVIENIRRAEKVALKYWKLGYAVICPHMNTACMDGECEDSVWLNGDLEILARCDTVVMMKGWQKSQGASNEHEFAESLAKIIIYDSEDECSEIRERRESVTSCATL